MALLPADGMNLRDEAGISVPLAALCTLAVAALITDWHGQGPLDLPGVRVVRQNGLLSFHPTT